MLNDKSFVSASIVSQILAPASRVSSLPVSVVEKERLLLSFTRCLIMSDPV